MRTGVAAGIAVLAVLAAAGIGLASGTLIRPSPTPIRVNVTFTPAPTPSPTPYNEAALFRQPISGGCATAEAVWLVTDGGGLLRYDGTQWAQVDGTLRSLTRVTCSTDTVFAVGHVGAFLVSEEKTRQIRALDITIEELWGISTLPDGALIVGSRGAVFLLDNGDIHPYAVGIDEDLFDVVAFTPVSAWAVGEAGITYRLDARGWNQVGSGQTNTLRAIAGATAGTVVAVGDAGTIVSFSGGWNAIRSGVDVTLRDVIVDPAIWIAGDRGTLLTASGVTSSPFRKIDIGTPCDLVSLFARGSEIWVVARGQLGGGVWRVRGSDGAVIQHYGGC